MKKIEINELKNIQLDILSSVHSFCKENRIQYSLAYGTLLGAVRHKGYIPWDDDIDIMMLRPEYERFLKLFNGYYQHLNVCAPELNLNYYAPYANIWDNRTVMYEGASESHRGMELGVKIDIFPIDVSRHCKIDHLASRSLYLLWCAFRYNGMYKNKGLYLRLRSFLTSLFAKMLGYKNVQKLIMMHAKKYTNKRSDFLALRAFSNRDNLEFCKDDFNSYFEIVFENRSFSAIEGYDDFLKCNYGNYMELPPEEKRIAHHNFVAYWR